LANREFRRLLGVAATEQKPSRMERLTHPEDWPQSVRLVEDLIAGRRALFRQEVRYRRTDGTYVWTRSVVFPVRDSRGAVRQLAYLVEDITEQKRAEEALRESEALVRQLAENIQDAFWMVAADFRVLLYASPAAERLWGPAMEAIRENPMRVLDAVHPDDRALVAAYLPPNRILEPAEIQFRVPHAGGIRWLRVRVIPIRDASHGVSRIAGITEDVTERMRAAEVLAEAREHAARLVRAVREPLDILYKALSPDAVPALSEGDHPPGEAFALRAAKLSPREREVMDMLVGGGSTKTIAAALSLSPRTVEVHRGRVMRKLGVGSVAELVRLALLGGPRGIP